MLANRRNNLLPRVRLGETMHFQFRFESGSLTISGRSDTVMKIKCTCGDPTCRTGIFFAGQEGHILVEGNKDQDVLMYLDANGAVLMIQALHQFIVEMSDSSHPLQIQKDHKYEPTE